MACALSSGSESLISQYRVNSVSDSAPPVGNLALRKLLALSNYIDIAIYKVSRHEAKFLH